MVENREVSLNGTGMPKFRLVTSSDHTTFGLAPTPVNRQNDHGGPQFARSSLPGVLSTKCIPCDIYREPSKTEHLLPLDLHVLERTHNLGVYCTLECFGMEVIVTREVAIQTFAHDLQVARP